MAGRRRRKAEAAKARGQGRAALALVVAVGLALLVAGLAAIQPQPAAGGPFSLVDTAGRRVTDRDLAGRPFAVLFGFTRCPEVCPTALQEMGGWLEGLGLQADRLRLVFVSLDPARDTPASLAAYMQAFDARILALTGSEAEVAAMAAAYRVVSRKVPIAGGDYSLDHTAAVFLMDGRGRLKTLIGPGEAREQALAKLRALIAAG